MASEAGLKPFETDFLSPQEVWSHINGYNRRVKLEWERTRAISFNVAKFGNSDPKGFPKTPQKFWPFPWDEKETTLSSKTILEQHARMVAMRKQFEHQL